MAKYSHAKLYETEWIMLKTAYLFQNRLIGLAPQLNDTNAANSDPRHSRRVRASRRPTCDSC
ncbi:hypothetical protein PseAD21_11995 [Pseudomonas sp. AD21]|nr:hypothetical protein PseAD21_11995 [Pseudomonas sp. AD21]